MCCFATHACRTAWDIFTFMLSHWFPIKFWIILAKGQSHKSWTSLSLTTLLHPSFTLTLWHPPPILTLFPSMGFLYSWLVSPVWFSGVHMLCVSVLWERNRRTEWVDIMNNAWCGFLVSETDCGDWTAAQVLFTPSHFIVKQTTSAESRDLSLSIHYFIIRWTAWLHPYKKCYKLYSIIFHF